MNIKIAKNEAIRVLKDFSEKGKEFFDINPLEIDFYKHKANDWYQELVLAVEEIFDDNKRIIKEMNKILNKDYNPVISKSLRWNMEMFTTEKERDKEFFQNKAKNVIKVVDELLSAIQDEI